jgi:hypothetical protein
MADSGAAEIKTLLDTPSASLGQLVMAVADGMYQVQQDDNATVAPSTFSAIHSLRAYYRNLGNTIQSIHTNSPAKGQVLTALTQLQASLATLSTALQAGTSADATADLTSSQQQSVQAKKLLAQAADALN